MSTSYRKSDSAYVIGSICYLWYHRVFKKSDVIVKWLLLTPLALVEYKFENKLGRHSHISAVTFIAERVLYFVIID